MEIKRREFVQIASVAATAGLLAPYSKASASPPAREKNQHPGRQFEMTIWGSCLYVLTNDARHVDLSFMTGTNVPDTMNVDHMPELELVNARVKSGAVTFENGRWKLPKGVLSIAPSSYAADAGGLDVVGHGQAAKDARCARGTAETYELSGFGYVPALRAERARINEATWRDRIATRIPLSKGRIDAVRPLAVPGDLAVWNMKGAGNPAGPQVVTDTTRYTAGLRDSTITFVRDNHETVVLEAIDVEKPLSVILRAGPAGGGSTLDAQGRLLHFGALYHIYETAPALTARGELYLHERCFRQSHIDPTGDPTPGNLCPGARVTLP